MSYEKGQKCIKVYSSRAFLAYTSIQKNFISVNTKFTLIRVLKLDYTVFTRPPSCNLLKNKKINLSRVKARKDDGLT